jgi:hypothetical protein
MISLTIALILSLSAIYFNRSWGVAIAFFVFIWILYGWNYHNGDYDAYERIYNASFLSLADENYEIGYRILCIAGGIIGLSFQQFLIIISAVIIFFLSRFVLRYSKHPALFICIFFWFFFPLDYVLLRNFFAFSIVLQGLICIIDNVRFKYFKYVIFVLLASLIHYSSFFYIILIPAFLYQKPISFLYVILTVLCGLILYKFVGQGIIINILSGGTRDTQYQTNFITFISLFFFQLLGTSFIIYLFNKNWRDIPFSEQSTEESRFYLIFLNINIIVFLVTVLYFDFSIFVRLYRNVAIINCIFILNLVFELDEKNLIGKIKLILFFACYLIFFFSYFIAPFLNDTLLSLFKFNKFLE